eukprot:2022863-Amphidinium_carterae.1
MKIGSYANDAGSLLDTTSRHQMITLSLAWFSIQPSTTTMLSGGTQYHSMYGSSGHGSNLISVSIRETMPKAGAE